MKRVLHISAMARAYTQFRFELLEALKAEGHGNTLIAAEDALHVEVLTEAGFEFRSMDFPQQASPSVFVAAREIRRSLRDHDVLMMHQPLALLVGTLATIGWDGSLVYFTGGLKANEGMHPLLYKVVLAVESRMLARVDLVMSVNREDVVSLERLGVASEYVGPRGGCGVDTASFKYSATAAKELRLELQIEPDARVVGMVGRIETEKGVFAVLEAFARLTREDWVFVIVGSGTEDRFLNERLAALPDSVSDRVRFVGRREDISKFYSLIDTFILASRREGMPTSLLEAMASDCVVASTSVRGAREAIKDGENGLLFESLTDLCDGLDEVLSIEGPRSDDLRREARETIETEYATEVLLPKTMSKLKPILAS